MSIVHFSEEPCQLTLGDLEHRLRNMVESSPVFPELMDYRARGLSDQRYRWACFALDME